MKNLIIPILFLLQAINVSIAATLTDPTKPASFGHSNSLITGASNKSLVLNAILMSPHGKQAIINGKLYVEGQSVLGLRLISIGTNQAMLTDTSGTKTLFVNNNNIKKGVHNGF